MEASSIEELVSLVAACKSAQGAVKCHVGLCRQLVHRAEAIEALLGRLLAQQGIEPTMAAVGGVSKADAKERLLGDVNRGRQRSGFELLKEALEGARDVIVECGKGRLYRAVNYHGIRQTIRAVWRDLDLGAVVLILEQQPEAAHLFGLPDPGLADGAPEEALEFGDAELAYRLGDAKLEAFVGELQGSGAVSWGDLEACRVELADMDRRLESLGSQSGAAALRRADSRQVDRRFAEAQGRREAVAALLAGARPCHTVPPNFLCSICYNPMLDPVCTEFGHAYDRKCIMRWLRGGHMTNPRDGRTLTSFRLVDALDLRQVIDLALSQLEPFRSSPRERWPAMLNGCDWEGPPGGSARLIDRVPTMGGLALRGSSEETLSETGEGDEAVSVPELPAVASGEAVLGWIRSVRLVEGGAVPAPQLAERLSGRWEGFYYHEPEPNSSGKMSVTFYGTVALGEDTCGPFTLSLPDGGRGNANTFDLCFLKKYQGVDTWSWSYWAQTVEAGGRLAMHGVWGHAEDERAEREPWALLKREGEEEGFVAEKLPAFPREQSEASVECWLEVMALIECEAALFHSFAETLTGSWRGFDKAGPPMTVTFEGERGHGIDVRGFFTFDVVRRRERPGSLLFVKAYDSKVEAVYSASAHVVDGCHFLRGRWQSRHHLFVLGNVDASPWSLVKVS